MAEGLQGGIGAISLLGSPPPMANAGMATVAPVAVLGGGGKKPKEWDAASELLKNAGMPMKNSKNSLASLSKQVGTALGVDPAVLLSSAWVEGGNKQSLNPGYVSPAYNKSFKGKPEYDEYPIDGFQSYGLDTIGDKWKEVKQYLPPDFESRLKFYKNKNELGQTVTSAAFDSDQAALMGKAAMLKYEQKRVDDYAKEKGISLDPETRDYFTMLGYNRGNAFPVMDEYAKDADKKTFISGGRTSKKDAHKNVLLRMKSLENARTLLKDAPNVVEE